MFEFSGTYTKHYTCLVAHFQDNQVNQVSQYQYVKPFWVLL